MWSDRKLFPSGFQYLVLHDVYHHNEPLLKWALEDQEISPEGSIFPSPRSVERASRWARIARVLSFTEEMRKVIVGVQIR